MHVNSSTRRPPGGRAAVAVPPGAVARAAVLLALLAGAGCQSTPPLPEGPCGNAELNRGEECDDGVLNSDVAPNACRSNCQQAHCGDEVIDSGEECDGENLAGLSCADFGFDGGVLVCDFADCVILTRHCTLCGDDLAEGAERCDGADLGGFTCSELGFGGGTLACRPDCELDRTGCEDGCGNGRREGDEECDDTDLGTASCEGLGFTGGSLACTSQCRYDLRGCEGGCGNGVVEPGEACDDGNDVPGDGCTDCRAGDGTFAPAPPEPTGAFPTALRVVDVNGDGLLDLVVGYAGEAPTWGGVAVHRNLGDRHFAPGVHTPLNVRVSALAVADLNADDRLDAAVTFLGDPADETDPGGLLVLPGAVGGGFDATVLYSPGSRPTGVEAGLLSGEDLAPDLAVLNLGSSNMVIFGNDGVGNLAPAGTLYAFGWPEHLTIGDLNGDGLPDLMVSRVLTATVAIFVNQGGGFASAVSRYVGDHPAGIVVGRVDGNESPDLVVALSGAGAVATLAGDGQGGFGYPQQTAVGGSPTLLVAERFDADAHLDVVVADGTSDTLQLLSGVGDGAFLPRPPIPVGDSPSALRAADLDGDGILDLVVTCAFTADLWILWGNEAVP